jgi:5-methylthioadenosine/S-adenosylhomocysteine deaminase
MSILIRNALLDGKEKDIYVEGNLIREIRESRGEKGEGKREVELVIEAKNKAAIPALFNAHTHAAMTLFRGYGDDMPLHEWLQEKIWPVEANLTKEDVYWGTKLACLEMIKSGTTFFNDMYWYWRSNARVVEEMGLRAALSAVFVDGFDEERGKEQIKEITRLYQESKRLSSRIIFALGPHSVYTVSEGSLCWVKEFSEKYNLLVHIHVAETEQEVADCIERYGMRPVEYLQSIGFLSPRTIVCHCVHVTKKEIALLKENEVKIVHNPTSNMKLASGRRPMPYDEMKKAGLVSNISLGTDGCASNNNLDMFEEMKMACLVQKAFYGDPTVIPAAECFNLATRNAAMTFRVNSGVIEEGKLADIVLVDLKKAELVPNHNLVSNLVYSANGSCVDTVICDGKVLMLNREVKVGDEDEEEIMERAKKAAFDAVKR